MKELSLSSTWLFAYIGRFYKLGSSTWKLKQLFHCKSKGFHLSGKTSYKLKIALEILHLFIQYEMVKNLLNVVQTKLKSLMTINPLLFHFSAGKFRREFKNALEKCRCYGANRGRIEDRSMYHSAPATRINNISPSSRSNYQLASMREFNRQQTLQTSFIENGNQRGGLLNHQTSDGIRRNSNPYLNDHINRSGNSAINNNKSTVGSLPNGGGGQHNTNANNNNGNMAANGGGSAAPWREKLRVSWAKSSQKNSPKTANNSQLLS